MKFFMQDDTSKEVDEVIAKLKNYMDGDVSEQMYQKGVDYKLNYGVSIVWLKKIAAEYKGRQELAERLWFREARETMIIASMIADVSCFDDDTLELWFPMIKTGELAVQFGTNILSNLSNAKEINTNYVQINDAYKKTAAWVALSIIIKTNELDNTKDLISYAFADITDDSLLLQQNKGRFLRAVCRKSNVLLSEIEIQLDKVKEDEGIDFLRQELQTEIDFLKS